MFNRYIVAGDDESWREVERVKETGMQGELPSYTLNVPHRGYSERPH